MTNLCLFACSEQFQLEEGALTFVDVIQDLGQQLGIKLTHIDYSSTEYQESDE